MKTNAATLHAGGLQLSFRIQLYIKGPSAVSKSALLIYTEEVSRCLPCLILLDDVAMASESKTLDGRMSTKPTTRQENAARQVVSANAVVYECVGVEAHACW
jgi:hypothetical protein